MVECLFGWLATWLARTIPLVYDIHILNLMYHDLSLLITAWMLDDVGMLRCSARV